MLERKGGAQTHTHTQRHQCSHRWEPAGLRGIFLPTGAKAHWRGTQPGPGRATLLPQEVAPFLNHPRNRLLSAPSGEAHFEKWLPTAHKTCTRGPNGCRQPPPSTRHNQRAARWRPPRSQVGLRRLGLARLPCGSSPPSHTRGLFPKTQYSWGNDRRVYFTVNAGLSGALGNVHSRAGALYDRSTLELW